MIKYLFSAGSLACLVLAPLSGFAADIAISNAWVRATIGQANVTAGYLTIVNQGSAADRLIAVEAPVAAKTEVHTTLMGEGGMMSMRPVESVDIPAGESVALEAGKDHLMLTGIKSGLKDGEVIDLILTFERAGTLEVQADVARRNPYP
ncbi:MAG: copper chaperone PCu(A)C [Rhodospirillaceae bacterium]